MAGQNSPVTQTVKSATRTWNDDFYGVGDPRYRNYKPDCDFSINQAPIPDPCPSCQGLVVRARGGATRCTGCGKGWAADGSELSEEEAKALLPKPRAKRSGGRTGGRSAAGRGARSSRSPRPRGPAATGDQAEASA